MRAPVILLAFTLCGLAASAADRDFKEIVRAIADEYHTQPTQIPMSGLVNAVLFVTRPGGAKQLDLAVFENLNGEGHDGAKVASRIRGIVGTSWRPFVEVRSRRKGDEITLIYVRPEGREFRMIVATIEHNEATVVHLKLDPSAIRRWMDHPVDEASESIPGDDRRP